MNQPMLPGRMDELFKIAQHSLKQAAVDAASLMGGGGDPAAGGMPPGGDPAAGGMPPGGMPPGGMPPGGDPMAGGAPPPEGGGGGMGPDEVIAIVQSVLQQQGGGAAGGAAGGGMEPIKPKIDVNVEIMQMKNLLAKLVDKAGIPVPAQEMTATSDDLTAMAMEQDGMGGGAGGAPQSAIMPPDAMGAASPAMAQAGGGGGKIAEMIDGGEAYDASGLVNMTNKAAALAELLSCAKDAA